MYCSLYLVRERAHAVMKLLNDEEGLKEKREQLRR